VRLKSKKKRNGMEKKRNAITRKKGKEKLLFGEIKLKGHMHRDMKKQIKRKRIYRHNK